VALLLLLGCGSHPEEPARGSRRCTLRISARGIYVDGNSTTRAGAVASCKRSAGAMVVLEDNAPQDEWKEIEVELRREGIAIYMRGSVGHRECDDNPLAKACM